ncbi:hypothetical protein NL676_036586 [Syzygium grande]|nr:hypothetical protein NL676_036586 [Syzygium grande]
MVVQLSIRAQFNNLLVHIFDYPGVTLDFAASNLIFVLVKGALLDTISLPRDRVRDLHYPHDPLTLLEGEQKKSCGPLRSVGSEPASWFGTRRGQTRNIKA